MQHRNLEPLSNKRVNCAFGEIVYSGPGLKQFEMFAVTFWT